MVDKLPSPLSVLFYKFKMAAEEKDIDLKVALEQISPDVDGYLKRYYNKHDEDSESENEPLHMSK